MTDRSSTDSTIQLLNDLTSASISRQRRHEEDKDVESSSWLGDGDVFHRFLFLRAMMRIGLPVPSNEGEWHAARCFSDTRDAHTYDVRQWFEYLDTKGLHAAVPMLSDAKIKEASRCTLSFICITLVSNQNAHSNTGTDNAENAF